MAPRQITHIYWEIAKNIPQIQREKWRQQIVYGRKLGAPNCAPELVPVLRTLHFGTPPQVVTNVQKDLEFLVYI